MRDHRRHRLLCPLQVIIAMALCVATSGVAASAAPPRPQDATPTAEIDVATIYFPSWHKDDHYSAWYGEGWNEWRLMESAQPRFEGHQHLQPAADWGYFDEADPEVMARQIDLAAEHGIDVFIFDWYWYSGVKFLHRALEDGFLKAGNRDEMKFALMWADHTWGDQMPHPYDGPFHWLLPIRHTPANFERVMAYCIDNYFKQPNYWRLEEGNGWKAGLYFSLFAPEDFVNQLGGPEQAKAVLDAAREQVRAAGLGEIHFAAFTGIPESIQRLEAAGFDSMTSYNVTTMSSGLRLPQEPFEPYDRMVERHESYWDNMDTGVLPYAPVVTVGWDVTPRWEKDIPWPPEKNHYPYTPIVTGNTPEKFGGLVRRALRHAQSSTHRPPFILVNAWNEWTEGAALLPNTIYGNGYLEALEAALQEPAEAVEERD